MKPKYSSSARIFARRGDPWVSEREGREKFGRNIESENPDFDQYFAGKAGTKEAYIDPKPEQRGRDYARLKVNAIRTVRNRKIGVTDVKETINFFKPCPGCRKASCIHKGICQK